MSLEKVKSRSYWEDVARKNGVKISTFNKRIDELNWEMEKAATTKTQQQTPHKKYTDLAKRNNVPRETYYNRFHNGWNPYEAATTPVRRRKKGNVPDHLLKGFFYNFNTVEKVKEYINRVPSMSRVEVLNKIYDLEKEREHANGERAIEIDEKIYELGKDLVIPHRQKKIRSVVEKGKNATTKDIEYLLLCGITKSVACEMLGISERQFYKHHNDKLSDVV